MTVFLVLQIIIVIALVAVILVQKTSSDGFTGASSSPNSFLTGRATANLFTRTTAILAAAFLINSLALAYMASKHHKNTSVVDKVFSEKQKEEAKKQKSEKDVKKAAKVKIEDLDETPVPEPKRKAVKNTSEEKSDNTDTETKTEIEKTVPKSE